MEPEGADAAVEVRFYLDVSSIVRLDWPGSPAPQKSNLEYVYEVERELCERVERVIPGANVSIYGCADNSLRDDFDPAKNRRPTAPLRDYWRLVNRPGFSTTPNNQTEADGVILEQAEKLNAIVVSGDKYGDYARHHRWLYSGGRLIQPSRIADGSGWTFTEYKPTGATGRVLDEILADLHPVFESYAFAEGACAEDLDRAVHFCTSRGHEVAIGRTVDRRQIGSVQEAVRDALRYRHKLSDLVSEDKLHQTDAIHVLALNGQNVLSVGNDLYLTDEGNAIVANAEPRSLGAEIFVLACEERSRKGLEAAVRRLERLDVDGLHRVAAQLQESLMSTGRISWRALECRSGPAEDLPLRWVVDHLRATRDQRRLATVRLADLPRLDPEAKGDVLIARHLVRSSGEWPAELLGKLVRLPPSPREKLPDLIGELMRLLQLHLDGTESLVGMVDTETLRIFCERYLPNSSLHDVASVLGGSVQPIVAAMVEGRESDFGRLVRMFFLHVLSISWIPTDVAIELMRNERILTALGSGQVDVLSTGEALRLVYPRLEGPQGAVPDLMRASRLDSRLGALASELRRAESLLSGAGNLVV